MRAYPRLLPLALVLAGAAAADAGWNEGLAAFNGGDYATAAQHFSELLKASPKAHQVLFMLGQCQERLGENADALANVSRAVELAPGSVLYKVELGKVLLASGRAGDAFETLYGLDPASMDDVLRTSHAQFLAGSASRAGRLADALPALEAALARSPENPKINETLAKTYSALGRPADAAAAWGGCFAADPTNLDCGRRSVDAAITACEVAPDDAERQQMQTLAVATAARLAEAAPTGEHLRLLDRSYAAAGDPDAALPHLEAALAAGADAPTATWIHARLARRCECRLDLDGAIRHHALAGNAGRAEELRQLAATFGEVLAQRQRLADTVAGLRATLPDLERIGDQAGADAVLGRIAGLERDLAAIDANLTDVRAALQAGCSGR